MTDNNKRSNATTFCVSKFSSVNWSSPSFITILSLLVFFNLLVIVGNIVVVLAVRKNRKLRNPINIFIVNLAFSDLFIGVFILPITIATEFMDWPFNRFACNIWLMLLMLTCSASIWSLCAISITRYIVVTRPMKFHWILSFRNILILIGCIWTLSFIISVPPFLGWAEKLDPCPENCRLCKHSFNYVTYNAITSFYVPSILSLYCYYRTYSVAQSTRKAIQVGFRLGKTKKLSQVQFSENDVQLRIHKGSTERHNQTLTQSVAIPTNSSDITMEIYQKHIDNKAARTIGIIAIAYVCCWLPFFTVYVMHTSKLVIFPKFVKTFVVYLAYGNSAVNPWICALSNTEFRATFKKMLFSSFGSSR